MSSAEKQILVKRRKGKVGVWSRKLAVSAIFLFSWKAGGQIKSPYAKSLSSRNLPGNMGHKQSVDNKTAPVEEAKLYLGAEEESLLV